MHKQPLLTDEELASIRGGMKPVQQALTPKTVQLGGGNAVTVGPFSIGVHLSGAATHALSGGLAAAAAAVPGPLGRFAAGASGGISMLNAQGKGISITNYVSPMHGPTLIRPR